MGVTAFTPTFPSFSHSLIFLKKILFWKRYDKNMSGAPTLEAFEQKEMEPHVFQEQLKRAFFMKVWPCKHCIY